MNAQTVDSGETVPTTEVQDHLFIEEDGYPADIQQVDQRSDTPWEIMEKYFEAGFYPNGTD